jgi:hypothetical protein
MLIIKRKKVNGGLWWKKESYNVKNKRLRDWKKKGMGFK